MAPTGGGIVKCGCERQDVEEIYFKGTMVSNMVKCDPWSIRFYDEGSYKDSHTKESMRGRQVIP